MDTTTSHYLPDLIEKQTGWPREVVLIAFFIGAVQANGEPYGEHDLAVPDDSEVRVRVESVDYCGTRYRPSQRAAYLEFVFWGQDFAARQSERSTAENIRWVFSHHTT